MLKVAFFVFVNLITLLGCNEQQDDFSRGWSTNEVLLHITELRKEVAALRKEIKSLKDDVANIPSSNGRRIAASLSLDKQTPLGDNKAPLAIVEFSDFQCPYCARHAKQVFPDLKKNFVDSGKVKYYMRNFPLSFHAKARDAAIVVECAGKQGKQWNVHEFLFENSRQLGDVTFNKAIEKFALNKTQFNDCRKDKTVAAKVDADMVLGQKLGVSGTPKFFVGRVKGNKLVDLVPLSGAQPYTAFERVINTLNKK